MPAISVSGCLAATAQVATLRPVSLLVPHLVARATAVDALISRVHEQFASLHELEKASISIGGLGPVKWGMTIQEAANAAQVSFVVTSLSQSPSCQYYLPENFDPEKAVRTGTIDGIGLMVVNGQVIRIDIWPGSPVKTPGDIGIGSTMAEVQAAYDGNMEVTQHPYTEGNYLTLSSEASGTNLYSLVFETDKSGKVTQFRAGQLPAVTWTEGCS
ncbi:hypothetical protein IXB28_14055 [Leptothoe kymatousa TAU-MAC 1615]|uniref:Uncharacterized protein n=1 Tax=Leptothoe kymatousa TAU-MAC 1615 TaxID=2364775 RepID=A0ABS5Y6V9_9CYAN|nr:hypothetical protein [Leptothoe kymatousa TAU-MAC 1615]